MQGTWGSFVARKPLAVALVSLLLAAGCSLGWLLQPRLLRTKSIQIWVPQNTYPVSENAYMDDVFKRGLNAMQVPVEPPHCGF